MSREELSRRTGISSHTIKSWENGARRLDDILKAQSIAQALECPLSSLWEGEEPLAIRKKIKTITITFTKEELNLLEGEEQP